MAARVSICRLAATAPLRAAPRLSVCSRSGSRHLAQYTNRRAASPTKQLQFQKRWESSVQQPWPLWQFKQIQDISQQRKNSDTIIIDVREPHEYVEGHIPNALNMPINSAPEGLFLSPEDFEDRFGFEKPEPNTPVVFYCKAGIRSKGASIIASDAGFKNVREYRPSFDDWIANNGAIERGKQQSS